MVAAGLLPLPTLIMKNGGSLARGSPCFCKEIYVAGGWGASRQARRRADPAVFPRIPRLQTMPIEHPVLGCMRRATPAIARRLVTFVVPPGGMSTDLLFTV